MSPCFRHSSHKARLSLSTHCLRFHLPALQSQTTNNHHSQSRAGGRHQTMCAVVWHHEAVCNLKLYFLLNTHANLQPFKTLRKQNSDVCPLDGGSIGSEAFTKPGRKKMTCNYLACPLEGTFLRQTGSPLNPRFIFTLPPKA